MTDDWSDEKALNESYSHDERPVGGHTAAPWVASNLKAGAWIINGGHDAYYPICSRGSTVGHMEEESYANARLIAAAPETAAALSRVDALLARRPALDDLDSRLEKIERAINTAAKADRLKEINAELVEVLKECRTDLMIAADNARHAAKTDPRWEGVDEKLMARVKQADAARSRAETFHGD